MKKKIFKLIFRITKDYSLSSIEKQQVKTGLQLLKRNSFI